MMLNRPPIMFGMQTQRVSTVVNFSGSPPRCFTASATTLEAVSSGTPTGPGLTGVELQTRQIAAAARGGNPRLIRIGAPKAAGVPNPAAPSINPAKQ